MPTTPVLAPSGTGASNIYVSTSATVLVAPVLATMVLVAGGIGATSTCASSTGATYIEAPAWKNEHQPVGTVGTFLQLWS